MKILFLNHNLAGRGTYFRCMGFARELARLGHQVHLWTCARKTDFMGTDFIEDDVHVWQTPRWIPLGRHDGGYAPVDNFARLVSCIEGDWDVVHAFDHRPNVLLPWLSLRIRLCNPAWGQSTLFVADWCDWWTAGGITTARRKFSFVDRIEQRIEEGSKRLADGVTVISSVLHDRALQVGVHPDHLLSLPSGVPIDQFPLLEKQACRHKSALPQDRPLLGFVGFSLWDMQLLADTFAIVLTRIPDAVLLVIGGGVEEPSKDIFRQRFQIGKNVIMPGVVPFRTIPLYLCACDIQLLPLNATLANRARFPNKLCDYLASERPIVASDIGETGRLIRQHDLGNVAKEGAASLAEACINLLHDPQRMMDCGQRARQLAETQFSYTALTHTLVSFYSRLGSSTNNAR